MKGITVVVAVLAVAWATPQAAGAQPLLAFGTFSMNAGLNGEVYPGASGGVLADVADSWISLGAQGDLFFSDGYFSGRGGPLVQVNVLRRRTVRIFGVGGIAWGEQGGPMFGAGIDLWPSGRFGFRLAVQDYLAHVEGFDCAFFGYEQAYCDAHLRGARSYSAHQPSVQVGVVWR